MMEQQQKLRELFCLKLQLMRLRRKKLLYLALANPRRVYQRTILRKRSSMGEFSVFLSELNSEPQNFFDYFRMNRTAFNELFERQHKIITRGKVARKFKGHTGIS